MTEPIGVWARELQPPDLSKTIIFGGKSYIFQAEASSQIWKNIYFLHLLNEKMEFILKVHEMRDFY